MLASFSTLPDDIIYVLGKSLNEQSPADAHTVMLICKRTQAVLLPIIYSSVYLRNVRHCLHTLRYLQKYPYVASYIRRLAVNPLANTKNNSAQSSEATEEWVARTLEELASSFTHLIDFSWDGSCLPKSKTFWQTLRQECPELGFISTAISQQDPYSWGDTTDFLKLEGLQGFSVKIKDSPDSTKPPQYLSAFPPAFWDMIHPCRSPKLRLLSFESDLLRSFNFNLLFTMCLPSLLALTIAGFVFIDFAASDFITFTQSAPSLQHLQISPVGRIPWHKINLSHIRHYGGNIYSVLTGAADWPSLQSLDISCFPLSIERMSNFLRKSSVLPSLKSLKLRLTSEDLISTSSNSNFYGDGDPAFFLLPAMARCYPTLKDLDLVSSSGSTVPWESMFLSLGDLPMLTNFYLTQVPPRFGGCILETATAALTANPNIEQVRVRRSTGPWHQTLDCKIGEKVYLRYISRQPPIVTVHHINYVGDEPRVSSSRLLVPCLS
ncbi:hypothetical protein P691DRAFT_776735 [Macrolepiota fuliginosa MF-IS2]|uniref:F-box domain-containing protein n=1 Tax=Macrolepiota fuliginosa MF-IS2 TaxID=1400762 RepID=A0A9P5XAA3_9AGAR|nr:hypothetical protein P691DRAFT_776735 [Macrolepiota fuliginosa MF-IS2]